MSAQIIPFPLGVRPDDRLPDAARIVLLRDTFVKVAGYEAFSVWMAWPDPADPDKPLVRRLLYACHDREEAWDKALDASVRHHRPLIDATDPGDAA